jgi:hypothetical protein
MKFASPEQYLTAGCLFLVGEKKNQTIFNGLHENTNGSICETGCAYIDKCQAYRILSSRLTETPEEKKIPMPTNAQIAAKLGVTKRQVSKMRIKGTLKAEILKRGLENEFSNLSLI